MEQPTLLDEHRAEEDPRGRHQEVQQEEHKADDEEGDHESGDDLLAHGLAAVTHEKLFSIRYTTSNEERCLHGAQNTLLDWMLTS